MVNFKVLIIGGGNCGLAIATGLKQAGIEYNIFERENQHDFYNRPRDWGMLLHWGQEYLARLLPAHLVPRLEEIRCDPGLTENEKSLRGVPYVDALTGELIAEIPMQGVNRVSRMKLRRFLTHEQNLNIKVKSSPSTETVRQFLVGAEAAELQPVDLTMINFPLGNYTADEARLLQTLHPIFKIAAHPERPGNAILAALDIEDSDDPTSWKFQNYIGWWGPPYAKDLQDMKTRVRYYKSFISSFCEPFRTAGLKLGDDDSIPIYPGQQWSPDMPWDNRGGRVTLAGDAAHSMVPQRGQGLNNAMKDAANLVIAIKEALSTREKTLKDAIDAYESEMKSRGVREVNLSLEQARKASNSKAIRDSPIFKIGWKPGEIKNETKQGEVSARS
ncbi:monooxygenase [Diaporthe eres]|nr:monooxygenase [Diaporthe eres]